MSYEVRKIIEQVAGKHGLSLSEMRLRSRARRYSWPRQEVMYRATLETRATLKAIAAELNLQDHTTVRHGTRAYAIRLATISTPVSPLHSDIHRKGYFTGGDKASPFASQQEVNHAE